MAEELLKKMLARVDRKDVEVSSAGIVAFPGTKPPQGAIEVMAKEGIDISNHLAVLLTKEKIDEADLILAMDFFQEKRVREMVPRVEEKTFLLEEFAGGKEAQEQNPDIPDPLGKPLEDYGACAKRIKEALKKALEKI
jgi:protein-tyrosine-phosphatase